MNLNHMEYLLVLAREQSFSRAAERLFISQPALTKALQNTEQEIGLHLFIREKRRVYPTPAGDVFLQYAEKISRMQKQTLKEIRSTHHSVSRKQRFAVNRLLGFGRYAECIGRFTSSCDGDIPDFFILDSAVALKELKSGRIDAAVVLFLNPEEFEPEIDAVSLWEEMAAVIIPEAAGFAELLKVGRREGHIPVGLLDGQPTVMTGTGSINNFNHMITNYLNKQGVYPDYRQHFANMLLAMDAAQTHEMLCFTHKSLVKPELLSRAFPLDPCCRYHHYFCTRKGDTPTPQKQLFLKMLLEESESAVKVV